MRFAIGVVVGAFVGRPLLTKLYRPMQPMLKLRILDATSRIGEYLVVKSDRIVQDAKEKERR